jgi:hypothetical protein
MKNKIKKKVFKESYLILYITTHPITIYDETVKLLYYVLSLKGQVKIYI